MTKPSPKPVSNPVSPARRRFLKTAAAGAVVTLGTPLYASGIEPEHLELVQRNVTLAGWPSAASGMKIGQLSDLHCQNERAVARTRRAVEMLLAQKPQAVFLTGDYVSGHHAADWITPCITALAPLASVPGGVYAVLGNHDWARGSQRRITQEMAEAGFQALRNRSVPLAGGAGVWVVGLDSRCIGAQNPGQALEGVPKAVPKILLVHEPDYADEAPPGFALQFSGHSHGGQIRLPCLRPLHCPHFGERYPEGWQQTTQHPVYTTRGVGMMGPQMRFCCPPEVTVLTLHPA